MDRYVNLVERKLSNRESELARRLATGKKSSPKMEPLMKMWQSKTYNLNQITSCIATH